MLQFCHINGQNLCSLKMVTDTTKVANLCFVLSFTLFEEAFKKFAKVLFTSCVELITLMLKRIYLQSIVH